jgi:NADPH:quinone reductase-like Zn-dependent oxidoreductase
MQAIVQRAYGPPDRLELTTVARPSVDPDEVLVRVHAASMHPDVWHMVRGVPYALRIMGAGLRRPKNPIPGTDVAGRVEAVGADVTRFAEGDAVFGETIGGLQWTNGGAYAEFVAAPADALAAKPGNLTFEAAAAVPTSGLIALQSVHHQGGVEAGERVLVNGAGGGVGLFAVGIAAAAGAEVTGVDAGHKLVAVADAGATTVIDYTETDYTTGGDHYDLVVDVPGNHPFSRVRDVLSPDGRYVLVGHDDYDPASHRVLGSFPRICKLMIMTPFVDGIAPWGFSTPPTDESMATLSDLLETGDLHPVVDRTFPLRAVPDALEYLESGDATGKIVVSVAE